MQKWAVQEAKARFSELLQRCENNGPQIVTKRGIETAVIVPIDVWQSLQAQAKPSLKELLLTDQTRTDIPLPKRGQAKRRTIEVI